MHPLPSYLSCRFLSTVRSIPQHTFSRTYRSFQWSPSLKISAPKLHHCRIKYFLVLSATCAFLYLLGNEAKCDPSQSKQLSSKTASNSTENSNDAIRTKGWHYYTGPCNTKQLQDLCLFSGNGHPRLAKEVAHFLGCELSPATVSKFADGECNIKIHENVRGKHCVIIQPLSAPVNDNLVELLLLSSALRRASAREITVVCPYFAYARSDKKMASRVPIAAADVANMMEECAVDRLIAVDLHSSQIQGFFSNSTPLENLQSTSVAAYYFSQRNLISPVIVAASAGSVLRAKKFRDTLMKQGFPETDLALLIESRDQELSSGRYMTTISPGRSAWPVELVGDVKGKDAIVIEDIADTSVTVSKAANELQKQGARRIYSFQTHGLLSTTEACDRIRNAPIDEIVFTNSVPYHCDKTLLTKNGGKITLLTIAPLLSEAIKRIHLQQSLSSLFDTHDKNENNSIQNTSNAESQLA